MTKASSSAFLFLQVPVNFSIGEDEQGEFYYDFQLDSSRLIEWLRSLEAHQVSEKAFQGYHNAERGKCLEQDMFITQIVREKGK